MVSIFHAWKAVVLGNHNPDCFWLSLTANWEPQHYVLWWIHDDRYLEGP